jgi:hypothetical protein
MESLADTDVRAVVDVGVEAGVWTVEDAHMLIDDGLDDACLRVLVEVEAVSNPKRRVSITVAASPRGASLRQQSRTDTTFASGSRTHSSSTTTRWR